jgi:hypothetical protein
MSIIEKGSKHAHVVKDSVTNLVAAIAALPDGPEKDAVVAAEAAMHQHLSTVSTMLSTFFSVPVTTFAGGTEK